MILAMKTLLPVLAVICLAEAAPAPSVGFLEDMSRTRIMYGQEASVGQFPHQLSLMVNSGNYHQCGAVLVDESHALSVAQCLNEANPGNYRIRAGQHTQGSPESEHDVSAIDNHEDYNQGPGTYPHSISVIYMASAADTGSSNIATIRIARSGDGDFTGDTCSLSGWGTTENAPSPSNLHYADMPVISNDECQTRMNLVPGATITDSHICVFDNTAGTCAGDTGGPLTCPGDVLAGLISWEIQSGGQCVQTYPTVCTRVSS